MNNDQPSTIFQFATRVVSAFGIARFTTCDAALRCMGVLLLCVIINQASIAATLEVLVRDRNDTPLNNVVVTVSDSRTRSLANTSKYIMDQVNLRFVPQVLVVPTGAVVDFPNSDTVSHQVYSFSRAKKFQVMLYKGKAHAPMTFDQAGLVVLGCNIHDDMIGYIYVTDAHWFGKTDSNGKFTLPDTLASASTGKVIITIWSPLIADSAEMLSRTVELSDATAVVEFKLNKALHSAPEPRPRNADWDY